MLVRWERTGRNVWCSIYGWRNESYISLKPFKTVTQLFICSAEVLIELSGVQERMFPEFCRIWNLRTDRLFWAHNPGSLIVYISLSNIGQSTKRHMWMFTVALVIIFKKNNNWSQTKYLPTWRDKPSVVYSHNGMLLSCSVVSGSLWPHRLQQARLSCPSLSPGVCSNSCPLSRWCYLTILSSASPFSFCLQSSQHQGLFQWAGSLHQVANVLSFSFSISSSSEYSELIFFRTDWECKGLSRVFSSTTVQKHLFFGSQSSLWPSSHILLWLLEKP